MWILTLIDTLTGFIPRPAIIRIDEGGFRQVPIPWGGTWLTEMKSGKWYWLIPWVMEHEIGKTKTQVKDIRAQSVWTKDGHDVTIGTSIRYYVKNVMKALLEVHDYDQSLQNIVLGVVCSYVREHNLEDLKSGIDELREKLLVAVKEASKGWGLQIQDVAITDVGKAQNFRILLSGDLGGIGSNV